jgi:hypothetical protein
MLSSKKNKHLITCDVIVLLSRTLSVISKVSKCQKHKKRGYGQASKRDRGSRRTRKKEPRKVARKRNKDINTPPETRKRTNHLENQPQMSVAKTTTQIAGSAGSAPPYDTWSQDKERISYALLHYNQS